MTIQALRGLDATLEYRIKIESAHRKEIEKSYGSESHAFNMVFGDRIIYNIAHNYPTAITVSKLEAIIINKIAGFTIFEIEEQALKKFEELRTLHSFHLPLRNRELPAPLEIPAASLSKKPRTKPRKRDKIKNIKSKNVREKLSEKFGKNFYQYLQRDTAPKMDAITINNIIGEKIFNINGEKAAQKACVEPPVQVVVDSVHRLKIKKLSKLARQNLVAYYGDAYYTMFYRDLTISKKEAIATNKIAGVKIFNINEEDDQTTSIPRQGQPQERTKGKKRQLPPSENPAALHSKKARNEPQIDADVQQTTTDVIVPFHNQIPLHRYQGPPFREIPPTMPAFNKSVTMPKETTVASEEFNSLSNSNATAIMDSSENPLPEENLPSSDLPQYFNFDESLLKDFNSEELNSGLAAVVPNNENKLFDWSGWRYDLHK